MAKVADLTRALAEPVAAAVGCSIWDVEYIKEAGTWFLRVYIDKPEGIQIDDCEAVSRALEEKLDALDPIEGSYVLEVSSSGIDRVLKTPAHFAQFAEHEVEVKLYRPLDGKKIHVGRLTAYRDGAITIETPTGPLDFEKKDLAQVRVSI